MSFGWSAGDIVSATRLLKKVGKALKDSNGSASDYQETASFLESLDTTLVGLDRVATENPGLEWEAPLVEQGKALKGAVDRFRGKIQKYDQSLSKDSDRNKARKIPREVQYALSEEIKDLKTAISRPQMVLNTLVDMQTLESVVKLEQNAKASQQSLERRTTEISAGIQPLSAKLDSIDTNTRNQVDDLTRLHRGLSQRIDREFEELRNQTKAIRVRQEEEIERAAERSAANSNPPASFGSPSTSSQMVTGGALVLGSGLASAIGTLAALSYHKPVECDSKIPDASVGKPPPATVDWSNPCWDSIPAYNISREAVDEFLCGLFGHYDFYTELSEDHFQFWVPRILKPEEREACC